jgi:hypothetical protein
VTENDEPVLDWQWIREAPVHELSAHGREVQARWRTEAVAPSAAGRRPSLLKRLRFRLWLSSRGNRRSRR